MKEGFNSSEYNLRYGTRAIETFQIQKGKPNLMATIVARAEMGEARLDDLDVRAESTGLIFAGSGTTANTLIFLS
ncbi:hypothetical protein B0A49_14036, partial [Cryomyces minteri]